MEWVETTGRTLEEAQDAALDQLGVDELDAEFEILEEPRLGLFGRVRTEARVRARVRPNRPPVKDERRGRRRRPATAEPASPAVSTPPAPRTAERTSAEHPRMGHAPSRDRQGGRMENDVPLAQQAEAATEFLAGLVGAIAGVGRVEVHEIDEHTVEVAVVGDGLGLLIGPSGATLAAVQDLTRTAVQRRTGGRNGRIMVDVGGYREKRRSALERFTREIASQVLETGQRKVLEPMQAADRKVVHDTVNSIDGVATASEGEEPRRRVVIQPV
ncbi:MAG: hypothetical protein CYG61_01350 [Actinobacteria bacterium]|nr:MAG: hypothetical protein CYG61_01350 [Actinomycetota bacterium]